MISVILFHHFQCDVYACGQVQTAQGVCCFASRAQNVDQSLVSSHFELFSGVFVFVCCSDDGHNFLLSRKWNRTTDLRSCFLCCFNDLRCRLIDQLVIVSFETDSDFWVSLKKSPLLFVL